MACVRRRQLLNATLHFGSLSQLPWHPSHQCRLNPQLVHTKRQSASPRAPLPGILPTNAVSTHNLWAPADNKALASRRSVGVRWRWTHTEGPLTRVCRANGREWLTTQGPTTWGNERFKVVTTKIVKRGMSSIEKLTDEDHSIWIVVRHRNDTEQRATWLGTLAGRVVCCSEACSQWTSVFGSLGHLIPHPYTVPTALSRAGDGQQARCDRYVGHRCQKGRPIRRRRLKNNPAATKSNAATTGAPIEMPV